MKKILSLLIVSLFIFGCSDNDNKKNTTPLIIKTANGDARFFVEIARTTEELKTGLMHRTELAANEGMIFDIDPIRPVAMWMKNTKLPLDMIFVGPQATIIMIKEGATPMSEEQIVSNTPVKAVIELNAGQVRKHKIAVGDTVNHIILTELTSIKERPEAPAEKTPPAPVKK